MKPDPTNRAIAIGIAAIGLTVYTMLIFAAIAIGMRLAGSPLHEVLTIKNFIISAASVIVHMLISESLRDLIQRGRVPVQRSSRQGVD